MPELRTVIPECSDAEPLIALCRGFLRWPVVYAEEGFVRLADAQYGIEDWLTLLDPAGRPFCLVAWGA